MHAVMITCVPLASGLRHPPAMAAVTEALQHHLLLRVAANQTTA